MQRKQICYMHRNSIDLCQMKISCERAPSTGCQGRGWHRFSNMPSHDLSCSRSPLVVTFHANVSLVDVAAVARVAVAVAAALASPLACTLYAFVALSKLLALKSGARQKHLTLANVDNLHCPLPRAINLTPPRPANSFRLRKPLSPNPPPEPFADSKPDMGRGRNSTGVERVAL